MWAAGTNWTQGPQQLLSDVTDDLRLPFAGFPGGGVRSTHKYKQIRKELVKRPYVKTIRGHSLSASVVKAVAADVPGLDYRAYNTPAVTFKRDKRSFTTAYDPLTVFDFGATRKRMKTWNPHNSYA